jgi:uracil-DNA glycosylase
MGSDAHLLWTTSRVSQSPARTPDEVLAQAADAKSLRGLDEAISQCRACPRLVTWREEVARVKRKSFANEEYWGRPISGFGPREASIVVVGLAPAAHGGNRTGRVFTGDRSGDWLYRSMYRAGLARIETSVSADDGQELIDTRLLAAVRCAPPANAPTPEERDTCAPWLVKELEMLGQARVFVALGAFAWSSLLSSLPLIGIPTPRPRPAFAHGAQVVLGEAWLLGSYHPSQQNTFTGRLTEQMLDEIFTSASNLSGRKPSPPR